MNKILYMHYKLHLKETLGILNIVLWAKNYLFFIEYKIVIEIDEYDHVHRDFEYEKGQGMIGTKLGCTVARVNPDIADSDINRVINLVNTQIKKQTKESTKKSLIDHVSRA